MIHEHKVELFSVPIWGFILENEKYHSIDYIEFFEELKNEIRIKKDLHKEHLFKELIENFTQIANEIAEFEQLPKLHISSMWGNVDYKDTPSEKFIHKGVLSGIFNLQTPAKCGRLVFVNPIMSDDKSQLIKKPNFFIDVSPLSCIFFPSWLEYYFEPNLSDDKRIFTSFDFDIEGNL
jgi:uncharacterized protein (TIGR02466 family)